MTDQGQQPGQPVNEEPQEKSQEQIMKEQEEKIKAKYGGMQPKKKGPLAQNREHKFFDSADWALNKEAAAKKGVPAPRQVPEEELKPKLEPTTHPTGRRISHMDSMDRHAVSQVADSVANQQPPPPAQQ